MHESSTGSLKLHYQKDCQASEHAVRSIRPLAEQRGRKNGGKSKDLWRVRGGDTQSLHLFTFVPFLRGVKLYPKQQEQQRSEQHASVAAARGLVGASSQRLLADVLLVGRRSVRGRRVAAPVGAHVVEVSGELHLFGFLAQRLPDGRRFVRTAGHRRVGTVVELVPRPAEKKRTVGAGGGDRPK